jgi:hypothetical protein
MAQLQSWVDEYDPIENVTVNIDPLIYAFHSIIDSDNVPDYLWLQTLEVFYTEIPCQDAELHASIFSEALIRRCRRTLDMSRDEIHLMHKLVTKWKKQTTLDEDELKNIHTWLGSEIDLPDDRAAVRRLCRNIQLVGYIPLMFDHRLADKLFVMDKNSPKQYKVYNFAAYVFTVCICDDILRVSDNAPDNIKRYFNIMSRLPNELQANVTTYGIVTDSEFRSAFYLHMTVFTKA